MTALTELRHAERNAMLWFAEVLRRKLFRQLGYASIQQYASEALGFSSGKTSQFIRLSESLRSLPKLNQAVATGEMPWTKAREVATVATRSTEGQWIEVARTSSRRDLERRISRSKAATRSARRRDPAQRSLCDASNGAAPVAGTGSSSAPDAVEVAVTVQLRFSPEQLARFEALVEATRKRGHRTSREELVLDGLEAFVSEGPVSPRGAASSSPASPAASTRPRIHRSPYQVVVYRCESCGKGHVPTSRGDRPLDLATLRTIACDAEMVGRGKRLRATIYPGKRREVLERDGHRCQAAGCRNTRFLQVHHLVPLEFGGTDEVKNLATLCRECHRWVHERHERLQIAGTTRSPNPRSPEARPTLAYTSLGATRDGTSM